MPKPPRYAVGERVASTTVEGGLWGRIREIKKTSITLDCDNGSVFVAKRDHNGFGLVRHGDTLVSGAYSDPKGIEESKRCMREAIKSYGPGIRDSFLVGKPLGRAIRRDMDAAKDKEYDRRICEKEALFLLRKIIEAGSFSEAHMSEARSIVERSSLNFVEVAHG